MANRVPGPGRMHVYRSEQPTTTRRVEAAIPSLHLRAKRAGTKPIPSAVLLHCCGQLELHRTYAEASTGTAGTTMFEIRAHYNRQGPRNLRIPSSHHTSLPISFAWRLVSPYRRENDKNIDCHPSLSHTVAGASHLVR